MTSIFEVWRRYLWLWVPPLSFCVLNLLGFALYGSTFAGKVERLELQSQKTVELRDGLREEHIVVTNFLDKVDAHRAEAEGLYHDYFQTEAQRFTRITKEVKTLARQAGLEPPRLSYPKTPFNSYDLVQRGINFSVDGSYDQLRKFINLLELSDHFLTLNSVRLSESGGSQRGNPQLGITLAVSTMFASREIEPRAEEEPSI